MSAEQYHRSLIMVTGQAWPQFDTFAAAMGRADYAQNTEQRRDISVVFDKFIHDASFHACSEAIKADVAGLPRPIILRHLGVSDRDPEGLRTNLDYLMLRALGQVMEPDDRRSRPWFDLLTAPPPRSDGPTGDGPIGPVTDEMMQERWTAVCIGLTTHPDFFTY